MCRDSYYGEALAGSGIGHREPTPSAEQGRLGGKVVIVDPEPSIAILNGHKGFPSVSVSSFESE